MSLHDSKESIKRRKRQSVNLTGLLNHRYFSGDVKKNAIVLHYSMRMQRL